MPTNTVIQSGSITLDTSVDLVYHLCEDCHGHNVVDDSDLLKDNGKPIVLKDYNDNCEFCGFYKSSNWYCSTVAPDVLFWDWGLWDNTPPVPPQYSPLKSYIGSTIIAYNKQGNVVYSETSNDACINNIVRRAWENSETHHIKIKWI